MTLILVIFTLISGAFSVYLNSPTGCNAYLNNATYLAIACSDRIDQYLLSQFSSTMLSLAPHFSYTLLAGDLLRLNGQYALISLGSISGVRNMETDHLEVTTYFRKFGTYEIDLDYPYSLYLETDNTLVFVYNWQTGRISYSLTQYLPGKYRVFVSRLSPSVNAFLFYKENSHPVLLTFDRDSSEILDTYSFQRSDDFLNSAIIGSIFENIMVFLSQQAIVCYRFENNRIQEIYRVNRKLQLSVTIPQFIQFTKENDTIYASFISEGINLVTLTYQNQVFSIQDRYSHTEITVGFIASGTPFAITPNNTIIQYFSSERPVTPQITIERVVIEKGDSNLTLIIGIIVIILTLGVCILTTFLIRRKRTQRQKVKVRPQAWRSNAEIVIEMKNVEDCCICLESVISDGIQTKCKHTFHVGCLHKWLSNHHQCPMCRTRLLSQN